MGDYLLRVWGADQEQVEALRTPDATESGQPTLCYWFPTLGDRRAFIDRLRASGYRVVWAEFNPGYDDDGELIDTHKETLVRVTLRLPDGRVGTFVDSFGYGYPRHSVEFMYREGNYNCDCNRRLFLDRHCGFRLEDQLDPDDNMCGDTIELVSLEYL